MTEAAEIPAKIDAPYRRTASGAFELGEVPPGYEIIDVATAYARAAEHFRRMPRQYRSVDGQRRGVIYAILYDTGIIKVGNTWQPRARLATHNTAARCGGLRIIEYFVSVPHVTYLASEATLIKICAARATPIGRETFDGLDFDYAMRVGIALSKGSHVDGSTAGGGVPLAPAGPNPGSES